MNFSKTSNCTCLTGLCNLLSLKNLLAFSNTKLHSKSRYYLNSYPTPLWGRAKKIGFLDDEATFRYIFLSTNLQCLFRGDPRNLCADTRIRSLATSSMCPWLWSLTWIPSKEVTVCFLWNQQLQSMKFALRSVFRDYLNIYPETGHLLTTGTRLLSRCHGNDSYHF